MNKVFKVVWNKTKGCWTVASELAKSYGRAGGVAKRRRLKHTVAGVSVTAVLMSGLNIQSVEAFYHHDYLYNYYGNLGGDYAVEGAKAEGVVGAILFNPVNTTTDFTGSFTKAKTYSYDTLVGFNAFGKPLISRGVISQNYGNVTRITSKTSW